MPGKMLECDGCHKIMRSYNLKNHLQTCKELKKDDDGGDVSDVNVKDSQTTTTKSETIGQKIADIVIERVQPILSKKRKADSLEESEDIPTTFEKTEFDGVESLSNENHVRILKLEKRFYSNAKVKCQECGKHMRSNNIEKSKNIVKY